MKNLKQIFPKQILYEPSQQKKHNGKSLQIYISGDQKRPRPISASQRSQLINSRRFTTAAVNEEETNENTRRPQTKKFQNYTQPASPVYFDNLKTLPQNIQKDKEQLYEEILQLKKLINELLQENSDVKSKLHFNFRDNERMKQIIQTVGSYLVAQNQNRKEDKTHMTKLGISENLLTVTLKNQICDLKKGFLQKKEEIKDLKSKQKITKISELEIYIEELQIEQIRLKSLLDQSLRNEAILKLSIDFNQLEEKFYIQQQIINTLKQENDYSTNLIRYLDEQRQFQEHKYEGQQKQIRSKIQIIDDLTQQLKDKTQQNEQLTVQIETYKERYNIIVQTNQKLENNQLLVQSLMQQLEECKQKINHQNINIEYMDKHMGELKQKLNDKSNFEQAQKQALKQEINKYQMMYEELDDKYKHLLLIQAQQRFKENNQEKNNNQKNFYQNTIIQKKINFTQESNIFKNELYQRKLRTLKKENVQKFANQLNMKFRLSKIEMVDIVEKYLFDDNNKKNMMVSIKDLANRFLNEPFALADDDAALLLARYLVEDNAQEFVQYDDNKTQQINIVTSIFTMLVGKYHILNANEEMKLKNQISVVIQKYKNSLKQHFDQVPSKYEGLLNKKQIMDTFIFMDIDFNPEQLDFIFLKLFALSNHSDLFPYSRLFEIFHWKDQNEKQEQQKTEKKKKKRESTQNRQFAFQGFDLQTNNNLQQ